MTGAPRKDDVRPGLRMLLEGLFDHAGMFPPAALSFDEAIQAAAGFDRLRRPWLVGTDMVLRLEDFLRLDAAALERNGYTRSCRVCVVGVPARRAVEAAQRLLAAEGPARAVTMEAALTDGTDDEVLALARAQDALGDVRLYVEGAWPDAAWQDRAVPFWRAIDRLAEGPVGAKFRCGGPHAMRHATQAAFIDAAAERRVPLKATQGLHHPFPTGHGHGFLTLAAAVRLRQALGVDTTACLAERDADAFTFDGLSWRGHELRLDQLAKTVRELPFSIGSCSLSEPDDDLAALWPVPENA